MTGTTTAAGRAAPDESRAAAFEQRFTGTLNEGALCLMASIGHRTGLYDTMAGMEAATPAEIARAGVLHERYVREWLAAMTVAGVTEHDPGADTYRLPAEHAAHVTRAASPGNLAVFAQYIGLLGAVEDDVVRCFREGGGVPYERYGRFHEVMAEDSGESVLPALLDDILPLVPGLAERLEQGIRVLDVGCGRGRALNLMAAAFPRSAFVGYDLSGDAIEYARAEAAERGNANVAFARYDVARLDAEPETGAFGLVTTFDAVHDQADPLAVVRGIRRSLAPEGVYLAQDIKGSGHVHLDRDHPIGPLLYTLSCMHCMTVSLAQGGEGLGAMWGREQALALFREAGFGDVAVHELDHDVQNYYYVCRP